MSSENIQQQKNNNNIQPTIINTKRKGICFVYGAQRKNLYSNSQYTDEIRQLKKQNAMEKMALIVVKDSR